MDERASRMISEKIRLIGSLTGPPDILNLENALGTVLSSRGV